MDPKAYAAAKLDLLIPANQKPVPAKRRSTLHAERHSLTGRIHIATPEESAAFEKHCRAYAEAMAPVGLLEPELVHEIAEDKWRLKRVRSIENSIFAQGHHDHVDDSSSGNPEVDAALAEGKTWVEQSRQLQLLTLYESRIRRAIERNTAELKAMQAERKEAYAKAQQDAILLSHLAEKEGRPYDPVPDFSPALYHGGFEFLPAEIARFVDRACRLRRALSLSQEEQLC